MQAFANLGVIAVWTGLIFVAWLLVKERGMKDRDLCAECVGIILALVVIWVVGSLIFLWTPTGIYFEIFLEGYNLLLLVPIGVITVDFFWQIKNLKNSG